MKISIKLMSFLAAILIIGIVTGACSSDREPQQAIPNEYQSIILESESRAAADGLKDFYTSFTTDAVFFVDNNDEYTDKNIVISPLSMAILLSMSANGIEDEEKQQIVEYLGVENQNALNALIKILLEELPKIDNQTKFLSENSIWINGSYSLDNSFSSIMSDYFKAELRHENFNSKNITDIINKWCSGKTYGLIPNLMDSLSPECIAVLINAMFFQGKWERDLDFQLANTKKGDFYGASKTSEVDMMHTVGYSTVYYTDENFDAFHLLFGNGAFRMMILLPVENLPLNIANSLISPQLMADIHSSSSAGALDITIPKFKISSKITANDILENSGLFLKNSINFSMFNPAARGALDLKQASSFSIDEEGATAAAVSSAEITDSGTLSENNKNIVDRPFYFFINEVSTGACILSGRIADL